MAGSRPSTLNSQFSSRLPTAHIRVADEFRMSIIERQDDSALVTESQVEHVTRRERRSIRQTPGHRIADQHCPGWFRQVAEANQGKDSYLYHHHVCTAVTHVRVAPHGWIGDVQSEWLGV